MTTPTHTTVWTLELHYLPTSMNKQLRAHWSARGRERKQLEHDLGWLAKAKRVPPATKDSLRSVSMILDKGRRARQFDDVPNLEGRAKLVLDALVNNQTLWDDSKKYLQWDGIEEVHSPDGPRLTITIAEISNGGENT